jgi:hypothetical protein
MRINYQIGDHTDQRGRGENIMDSLLDGEHASTEMVAVVGPEEPATSQQRAQKQNPAWNGGFGSSRRRCGALWSCFLPREIL